MARHDKPSRINKGAAAPAERYSQKGQASVAAAQHDLGQTDKWADLARHRKIKEKVMVNGQTAKTYLQVARKTSDAAVFIAVRRAGDDYRVHFHPKLDPHSENVRELIGQVNRVRPEYESKWMSYHDFMTLMDLVFKDRSYAVLPTPEALAEMGVNIEGEKVAGLKNAGHWRPGDDKFGMGLQGGGGGKPGIGDLMNKLMGGGPSGGLPDSGDGHQDGPHQGGLGGLDDSD